ncbi:ATP-binding cassette domain-containing protein [Peptococcaceae bacterium]|nr:ATP-binding cassette domain-containing protein [Peptococcaceae bacterium]
MLLNFKNITYPLGTSQKRQILTSGTLNAGEILLVHGPSGCGKSTLLRVLTRLQPCSGGEVFLNGKSWSTVSNTAWRIQVHYLSQKPVLFNETVAVNLARPFTTHLFKNKKELDLTLAKKIMDDLLLPADIWEQNAKTLSGGEMARIAFVRALLIDPTIMLLDEPTAALDQKSRQAFYQVLSAWLTTSNKGALLISHHDDLEMLKPAAHLEIKPI